MKRILHFINVTLAISGLFIGTASGATPITLKNIRVSETAATTQITLEFSQNFEYEDFELHSPERFVVDLYRVKLGTSIPDENLPAPLKSLRSSVNSEKCRLVMDL